MDLFFKTNYYLLKIIYCLVKINVENTITASSIIAPITNNFVVYDHKLELYCGISAIIIAYIIFIAELVSKKENGKIYNRIIISQSNLLCHLIITMINFILIWYVGDYKNCNNEILEFYIIFNSIITSLILYNIFHFIYDFGKIIKILKSEEYYNNIKSRYVLDSLEEWNKNNSKIENAVMINKNLFQKSNYKNIVYQKYFYDYNKNYRIISASSSGIINWTKKISFQDIDSHISNKIINISSDKVFLNKENNYKLIICYVDGEYVKKDSVIAYIPNNLSELERQLREVNIKPVWNNNEIVTEIMDEYSNNFINNCKSASNYLSEKSSFDFYELSKMILDTKNQNLISLLYDSLYYINTNNDNENVIYINNIIYVTKNILFYIIKNSLGDITIDKKIIDLITYNSFNLLKISKETDDQKKYIKFYMENIVSFVIFEIIKNDSEIKEYFIGSVVNYIKLIISSNLKDKYDLLEIIINHIYIDKDEYDIFTLSDIRKQINETKNRIKKEKLMSKLTHLDNDVNIIINSIINTILALLYDKDKNAYQYNEILNSIINKVEYGYSLHEILFAYLHANEASYEITKSWGEIIEPYNTISDIKEIDRFNALIVLICLGDIIDFSLYDNYFKFNDKYFIERIINTLKNINTFEYKNIIKNIDNRKIDEIIANLNILNKKIIDNENKYIIRTDISKELINNFVEVITDNKKQKSNLIKFYKNNKLINNSKKEYTKYFGYNMVIDKDLFINHESEIIRLANDIKIELLKFEERNIINDISKKVYMIDADNKETAIEKAIDMFREEKINDTDIIIVCDYLFSKKIVGKKYRYKNNKYEIIDGVSTNGKIYILDKKKLPKLNLYKFTGKDNKILNVENSCNEKLFVCIKDLSKDYKYRKKIINQNPDWLEDIDDKDYLLKTKVLINVFKKSNIKSEKGIIGYFFENK